MSFLIGPGLLSGSGEMSLAEFNNDGSIGSYPFGLRLAIIESDSSLLEFVPNIDEFLI